jgi:hypothetical protein
MVPKRQKAKGKRQKAKGKRQKARPGPGFSESGEYHREYYGDLLAKYGAIDGVTVDFDWWFHSFKNTLQSSPSPAEFARYNLEDKLCATSTNKALGSPLKIISKSSSELKDACRGLNNIKLQTEGPY